MGRQDMALEQFDRQMIHELELFFRTDCRLSINTTAKMMSMVRKKEFYGHTGAELSDKSVLTG